MAPLIFFFLAAAMAWAPGYSRIPGAVVLHEFQGTGTIAVDTENNSNLSLTSGITWNQNRTGVYFALNQTGAISLTNFSSILNQFNQTRSFTLEFWLNIEEALNSIDIEVAGFFSPNVTYVPENFNLAGNSCWAGFGLRSLDQGSFSYYDTSVNLTKTVLSNTYPFGSVPNTVNHLVVAVTSDLHALFYRNGQLALNKTLGGPFAWNTMNPYYLQVGPTLVATTPPNTPQQFVGDMYLLAVYARALNSSEVLNNYNTWIPNSLPIAFPQTINGLEEHIANFSISAYDFDVANGRNDPQTCFLTPPSLGTIFEPNGSVATSTFSFSPNDTIEFLGAPLGYGSNYATSTYWCMDSSGAVSNNATVVFNLSHVNHPPVAYNITISGQRTAPFFIQINPPPTDIDGDGVNTITIATYPMDGIIKQFDNTSISKAPINLTSTQGFWYTPSNSTGTPGQAIIYTDIIEYYCIDRPSTPVQPLPSKNATITINVLNDLSINPPPNPSTTSSASGNQDTETLFALPGYDVSNQPFDAFVLSLPTNGTLYLPNGTQITEPFPVGGFPAAADPNITNGNAVYVLYKPPPGFFGAVSFTYVLRTRDGWPSANATMVFQVNFVDQAPVLNQTQFSVNLTAGDSQLLNFTMYDVDSEESPTYSYSWNSNGTGSVGAHTLCNCSNITGNPVGAQSFLPFAFGAYEDVQQALTSLVVTGINIGNGTFTLIVYDYDSRFLANGFRSSSVQVAFNVSPAPLPKTGGLSTLIKILVYCAAGVGGLLCVCMCCAYCAWRERNTKKKFYEQGYTAEATSMDRL